MDAISLEAPYLDSDADQLCFSLDLSERPALAERALTAGGFDVTMRLLGASHQVFAGPVRETVACLPGTVAGLPATFTRSSAGWTYDFGAHTRRLPPETFGVRVAEVLKRAADTEESLCGVFPGSPEAVTAVVLEAGGGGRLVWRTWHTYPQSRQIVSTYTRLEAR
ncbi:hypothetical protein SRB5_58570 [Streptomyces sp. RB5]|uniref:DUF2617 domain-containing protein n=1 Tax=Streptomyces smaragdinus TaxID=2585196 RepID=A0A7K0CQC7_9ACTN|nr:DUF2617 family protein [Streptomyces smaragdinus]MQY15669.1 hypothetical protein [Streptomyces smaragdinus]